MKNNKNKKDFTLTRVVSRDLLTDAFQGLRNMFGMRLRGYEKRIRETLEAMLEEMRLTYKVEWYHISINPLTSGSVMVTIYGEGEEIGE